MDPYRKDKVQIYEVIFSKQDHTGNANNLYCGPSGNYVKIANNPNYN